MSLWRVATCAPLPRPHLRDELPASPERPRNEARPNRLRAPRASLPPRQASRYVSAATDRAVWWLRNDCFYFHMVKACCSLPLISLRMSSCVHPSRGCRSTWGATTVRTTRSRAQRPRRTCGFMPAASQARTSSSRCPQARTLRQKTRNSLRTWPPSTQRSGTKTLCSSLAQFFMAMSAAVCVPMVGPFFHNIDLMTQVSHDHCHRSHNYHHHHQFALVYHQRRFIISTTTTSTAIISSPPPPPPPPL